MVTRRQVVGAHYGLKDWLLQRLTAVVIAAWTVVLLAVALWQGGFDYALWTALFANAAFRVFTFLFMVSLLYHAWIGVRDIFMDYIKPVGVRLALQFLAAAALIAYLGWTIQILWGAR
jgi:succinate dehydrogenase / fumarate reductase membrane anchor subunit